MRPKLDNPDAAIALIASCQHGVITLTQLIQAGLSRSAVKRRVAAGRLHRIHRGVYAVGHSGLSHHGRWMAAVLACGPGAVLSHRAAAELWRLLEPSHGDIDVTVPGQGGRAKRRMLRIHRSSLPGSSTTVRDRIAVTTPAPEVNRRIGRWTVDFLWRKQRLVVEVDAWSSHRGRQAFEDDHRRDLELEAIRYTVRRFTDRQIRTGPAAVAAAVRTALSLSS